MFKTLSQAKAEIEKLTVSLTEANASLSSANSSIETLTSERDSARSELADAEDRVTAAATRATTAEAALEAARGEHETIDARIAAEASTRAIEIAASAGFKPVPAGGDGGDDGDPSSSAVTKENFWQLHSACAPAEKQDFYLANKHIIGR